MSKKSDSPNLPGPEPCPAALSAFIPEVRPDWDASTFGAAIENARVRHWSWDAFLAEVFRLVRQPGSEVGDLLAALRDPGRQPRPPARSAVAGRAGAAHARELLGIPAAAAPEGDTYL